MPKQPKFPLVSAKQKLAEKQSSDNTRVTKRMPMDLPAPKFSYKREYTDKYTKDDSALYRKGFVAGLNEVSRAESGRMGGKYKKGYRWVGLSEPYNQGFSEGKDLALEKPIKGVVKKKSK